jgi:hypothetical protein
MENCSLSSRPMCICNHNSTNTFDSIVSQPLHSINGLQNFAIYRIKLLTGSNRRLLNPASRDPVWWFAGIENDGNILIT